MTFPRRLVRLVDGVVHIVGLDQTDVLHDAVTGRRRRLARAGELGSWALGVSGQRNGLAAFREHWWCPIPLAVMVLGVAGVIAAYRLSPAA
jgi:hypothetical protein